MTAATPAASAPADLPSSPPALSSPATPPRSGGRSRYYRDRKSEQFDSQVRRLLARWKRLGDKRDLEKVLSLCSGIAFSASREPFLCGDGRGIARHGLRRTRSTSCWEEEELHSAARIGIFHAARNFDPERGVTFAGFAYEWARRCVLTAKDHPGPCYWRSGRKKFAFTLSYSVGNDPNDPEHPGAKMSREAAAPEEDLSFGLAVQQFLASQEPQKAQCFLLHCLAGFTTREVATMVGVGHVTVHNWATQIKEGLKAWLFSDDLSTPLAA